MRTEQEMFNLILNVAKNDKRIRAVYLTVPRTNPNAIKDIFRDYHTYKLLSLLGIYTERKNFS